MDVLSDVLRAVRLQGALFFTARLSSPWAVESPPAADLCRALGLGESCLTLFHLVVAGRCWVESAGTGRCVVEPGSIIIFPHGDQHAMHSDVPGERASLSALLGGLRRRDAHGEELPRIELGGGGASTELVCGYLRCDPRCNPLIGALPTLLLASPHEGKVVAVHPQAGDWREESGRPTEADRWVETTMRYTIAEAQARGPGSAAILPRLTEMLYLAVLRRYVEAMPADRGGWLGAVRDPEIGRALRLMHSAPDHKWTVARLARECGVSRSALAERFTEAVGVPPMRYLAGWRVQVSKQLMLEQSLSIAQVAERVGYESGVAFHRAFKRHEGRPPASWRRSAEAESPALLQQDARR